MNGEGRKRLSNEELVAEIDKAQEKAELLMEHYGTDKDVRRDARHALIDFGACALAHIIGMGIRPDEQATDYDLSRLRRALHMNATFSFEVEEDPSDRLVVSMTQIMGIMTSVLLGFVGSAPIGIQNQWKEQLLQWVLTGGIE